MVDNYLKIPEFINIVDLINKRNFLDANLKLDSLISRDKDSYFLNNIKGVILDWDNIDSILSNIAIGELHDKFLYDNFSKMNI